MLVYLFYSPCDIKKTNKFLLYSEGRVITTLAALTWCITGDVQNVLATRPHSSAHCGWLFRRSSVKRGEGSEADRDAGE